MTVSEVPSKEKYWDSENILKSLYFAFVQGHGSESLKLVPYDLTIYDSGRLQT